MEKENLIAQAYKKGCLHLIKKNYLLEWLKDKDSEKIIEVFSKEKDGEVSKVLSYHLLETIQGFEKIKSLFLSLTNWLKRREFTQSFSNNFSAENFIKLIHSESIACIQSSLFEKMKEVHPDYISKIPITQVELLYKNENSFLKIQDKNSLKMALLRTSDIISM
ncbi:MAG: hypothetical protein ACI9AR_000115 [Flavobacteriaceae bacterium]|jgi:hypothetical protein